MKAFVAAILLCGIVYQYIDWVCMSRCQQAGYSYGYCQSICSY